MQRKTIFILFMQLVILGLGIIFAGYSRKKPVAPPIPLPIRQTLVIECPSGIAERIVENQGKVLGKNLNLDLRINAISSLEIKEFVGTADIQIFPAKELGNLMQKKALEPFDDAITQPGDPMAWQDVLPLFREKLSLWNRKVMALPLVGENTLGFYREDLFENKDNKTSFKQFTGKDLKPASTWEELITQAEFFLKQPSFSKGSLSGLAADDLDLANEFLAISSGYSRPPVRPGEPVNAETENAIFTFVYNFQSGKPNITSPGFVKALEIMKRIQKYRSPDSAAFAKGNSIFQPGSFLQAEQFQKTDKIRDKFGIMQIPGAEGYFDSKTSMFRPLPNGNRIPYLGSGSLLIGVSSQSSNKELAKTFATFICRPEFSERIAMETWADGFCRYSHLDKIRLDSLDLDLSRTSALKEAVRQFLTHPDIRNPTLCLRIPNQKNRMKILGIETRKFLLAEQGSPLVTLKDIENQWLKIDAEIPENEFKSLVRQGAGLLPD